VRRAVVEAALLFSRCLIEKEKACTIIVQAVSGVMKQA
jgi:hypothetical protein